MWLGPAQNKWILVGLSVHYLLAHGCNYNVVTLMYCFFHLTSVTDLSKCF